MTSASMQSKVEEEKQLSSDVESRGFVSLNSPLAASFLPPPSSSSVRLSSSFLCWWYQLVALSRKNLLQLRRMPLVSLTFIVLPATMVMLLYGISQLVQQLRAGLSSLRCVLLLRRVALCDPGRVRQSVLLRPVLSVADLRS